MSMVSFICHMCDCVKLWVLDHCFRFLHHAGLSHNTNTTLWPQSVGRAPHTTEAGYYVWRCPFCWWWWRSST